MPMNYRVALYARVSTEEQKNHGFSIETQLDELRKYANKHEYYVHDEYVDEGFSGGTLNRPALKRLLDDIRKNQIDIVIFVKLDRWFRSVQDYYKIQELLDERNVEWICTQEDYETITSSGKFKVNIMLSVSQQFKDATSERIRSVFAYKKENGFYVTRSLPIGYRLEKIKGGNIVVKDEKMEEIINDLIHHYQTYHIIQSAMNYVNDKYHTSITRKNVETLFESPLLHGEYQGKQNFCEGYLSKEEHEELIHEREKKANGGRKATYEYIFTGKLICPICGRKLAGSKHYSSSKDAYHKYIYPMYRCNKAKIDKTCSNKKHYYETIVEEKVVAMSIEHLHNEITNFNLKNNTDICTWEKHSIVNQMKKLTHVYQSTDMSEKRYKFELKELEKRLEILETTNVAVSIECYEKLTNKKRKDYYGKLSNADKRKLWDEILESIEFKDEYDFEITFKKLL